MLNHSSVLHWYMSSSLFFFFSHLFGCGTEIAGLNMIVCVVIGVAQLLIWATWGFITKHPARFKLWSVVFGAAFAMLLEVFDFPPLWGIFDAHAIWHAATLPITYLWWSFIKDDATYRTEMLVKKSQASDFQSEETRKTQ